MEFERNHWNFRDKMSSVCTKLGDISCNKNPACFSMFSKSTYRVSLLLQFVYYKKDQLCNI